MSAVFKINVPATQPRQSRLGSGPHKISVLLMLLACLLLASVQQIKAGEIQTPEALAQAFTDWSLKALPKAVAIKEKAKIQRLRTQLLATYSRLINRIIAKNWTLEIGASPAEGFDASTYVDQSNRKVVIDFASSFRSVNASGQGDLTLRVLAVLHELHNGLLAEEWNALNNKVRKGRIAEVEFVRENIDLELMSARSALSIVEASLASSIKELDDWGISKMLPEEKRVKSKSASELMELVPNSPHEQHYRKYYRALKPGG